MKDNVYKVNEELIFRETELGWVVGRRLQENKNNNNLSCYLLKDDNSVEDSLKLFFELESLGIKDDPYNRQDDQNSFMYVDDWITGQDTREEALLISLHAENIMKEAGMEMRKWISNDITLMSQWAAKGFDTYPVDTSVSL
ncbi:hypothetical protein NPIL_451971 [Nephila pilipes]|uniref:Uncharacterized protein n=1 Tax=Nephila pilipes TaxID=299642 RepID=A0A8X6QV04_NEPPI|nr:hypothetical protein NPIL_451971 [Nephila pilipes]